MKEFDVIVIGGGMIGLAFTLALSRKKNFKIAIIDPNECNPEISSSFHTRVSAITPSTKNLLRSINIYEDPLQLKTLGSRAFDLDGVLKSKQFFVEDGRVISYLMGQYSANQLGLESTANAGGVSNCRVSSNYDGGIKELTKNMDKGLIVTDLMGQGINATTGDYSRGASGFWVEKGQIQYPVSGITIAGNLKDMLKNVISIGNDFDNRSNLKVGSTLVSEMTIAGEG